MKKPKALEAIVYQAKWDEIQKMAKQTAYRLGKEEPYSVNQANYALDLLGISYIQIRPFLDENGEHQIAWK